MLARFQEPQVEEVASVPQAAASAAGPEFPQASGGNARAWVIAALAFGLAAVGIGGWKDIRQMFKTLSEEGEDEAPSGDAE